MSPGSWQVPLSEDKTRAKKMARKLAGDAELKSVGLNDPYEVHRDMPIRSMFVNTKQS